MNTLNQFSRYFVGILFIISGLIKLNDPVGTQIKMEEYFEVLHIPFFVPFALYISVLMCALEVILGVALLFVYRLRYTLLALLGLIIFFTFLTFYSAYFNKVTDCGCFGDAIKLKPWESFSKDVVLLFMIVFLYFNEKKFKPSLDNLKGDLLVGLTTILSFWFAIHCINHLSIVDFRAYKVGVNIKQAMTLPPDAKQTIYQSFITLKKEGSGELKKVNDKEYIASGIWQDTTWKYQERSEPVLVQKGDEPKIKDFKITDPDNADATASILEGNTFAIIFIHAEGADTKHSADLNALAKALEAKGVKPVIITASSQAVFETFRHENQLAIPYYFADEKVLKTIIRANPGMVLLKNGTVVAKWHNNDTPTPGEVIEKL